MGVGGNGAQNGRERNGHKRGPRVAAELSVVQRVEEPVKELRVCGALCVQRRVLLVVRSATLFQTILDQLLHYILPRRRVVPETQVLLALFSHNNFLRIPLDFD